MPRPAAQIGPIARACCALACLAGCGAKTGLLVPHLDVIEEQTVDAAVDVPIVPTDAPTYLGVEFWAVPTANGLLQRGDTFHFAVALGNPNATPVAATIEGGALDAPMRATVPANGTVTVRLPWVTALTQNSADNGPSCTNSLEMDGTPASSALVMNGAYHITTDSPVSAYEFNPLEFESSPQVCTYHSYTNDASLLLPSNALTGDYLVLSHYANGPDGSFVAITGTTVAPTTVTITLTADTTSSMDVDYARAGDTITYTLAQGEVLQLVTVGPVNGNGRLADLTGTVIRASNPVSVIAGVDCSNISWPDDSQLACDHLEQQIFPEETWGLDAIVSQLQDRAPDENYVVRILSQTDGNAIRFTPPDVHAPTTLDRGAYLDFESNRDFVVTGTSPILVAQFMEGEQTTPGADVGDPAMVLEVPTEQYRHDYNFVVPATYTLSFINVVSAQGSVVTLDGAALTAIPVPIAGTPWQVTRLPIDAGSHSMRTSGTSGFGLKVLGVASYTSYMYPGGLDLSALHH